MAAPSKEDVPVRLLGWLVLAVSLALPARHALLANAPSCDVCHDESTVRCPTCEGKGTFLDKCPTCDGKGTMPCPIADCGTTTKGMRPCPNPACEKGKIHWEGGDVDPCRLCGGRGAIDCAACNDSVVTCMRCAGKHTIQWACLDCRATGRVPCPKCQVRIDASDCPWCHGAPDLACPRCKGTGNDQLVCPVCKGTDKAYCPDCRGLGKIACSGCLGTGSMRYKMVDRSGRDHGSGGRRSHEDCNGTGVVPCPAGKDRTVPCWVGDKFRGCKHDHGKLVTNCFWCDGTKHLPCGGCDRGDHRAFEVSARVLAQTNHHTDAAAMFRVALARAQAYFARGPQEKPKTPDDLAAFNRRRSDTLGRLESEIATEEKSTVQVK
jgi:hypothetical protein